MGDIIISDKKCRMEQVKETVYSLVLPSVLPADDQLDIQMEYTVNIPNIQNRFGYQDNVFNLGNFIATPAVYGEDGWTVEPYVDFGDAFYTDIANYEVKIIVPDGYTVAATGEEIQSGLYRAENVRDFAFCASDSYETISDELDGVVITVYYGDKITMTAERAMEITKKSIELYSNTFGKYPYRTLKVVMNGLTGGVNGMEYPSLIMISLGVPIDDLADMGFDVSDSKELASHMLSFDDSICHEIAHQWFYNVVGNDQISEPWLDEGFCRFSEYLYQQAYPPEVSEDDDVYLQKDRFNDLYKMISGEDAKEGMTCAPDTTSLEKSLYYWMDEDAMGYGEIYDISASLIYGMQQQLGETAFASALKEYVAHFAYGFVTTKSFKEFWNDKADFSRLFELYILADGKYELMRYRMIRPFFS